MDKENIINNIKEIYNALNTLKVSGYADCKTLSNCMEALNTVTQQVSNLEIKEKNTEGD